MEIVRDPIPREELVRMAHARFGDFVKAVNIRPSQGNRSRGVDDPAIRGRILALVDALLGP
ncbi:MAG: hypothetical protein KKA32_13525 [Actinobacteria bacterium]|nr:hypothetical protein [Actinomycetota bacterium]